MTYIVRALAVCLIAFTALAMAFNPWFKEIVLVGIGPLPLYPFDLLLLTSAVLLLYAISLRPPIDPCPDNRVALRLVAAYVLYQACVVAPYAFFAHHISLGTIFVSIDGRLAFLLIPFFYFVGLRYVTAERLVTLVNVAAVLLLVYALYRYAVFGPQGFWDGNEYRLRLLWGGSTFLFGWLAITALFLHRPSFLAYVLAISGILGIALENHRSGYVALILAIAYQTLSTIRVSRRLVWLVCIVVVAWASLSTVSPTLRASASYSLRTMFNPHADVTASDRVQRSELAWDYFLVHPLGDYIWTHTYYLVDLGTDGFEPHNFVMQALDKQGIISAGLIFAIVITALWIGWHTRRRSRLGVAMTTYLVFYLVFCLFNANFDFVENVTLFALAVALILHANKVSRVTEKDESPLTAHAADGEGTGVETAKSAQ